MSGRSPTGPGSRPAGRASKAVSPVPASIPSAGNAGPDWFEVARALANAIMFQRGTRGEHVIGKDGRVRMGVCDLFGCYAVDDAARDFCELAGLPFDSLETPNEHQALFMSVTGRTWRDWFSDRVAIVEAAGPSPGRGKVNMKRIASAIEARRAASEADDSAAQRDRPQSPIKDKDKR